MRTMTEVNLREQCKGCAWCKEINHNRTTELAGKAQRRWKRFKKIAAGLGRCMCGSFVPERLHRKIRPLPEGKWLFPVDQLTVIFYSQGQGKSDFGEKNTSQAMMSSIHSKLDQRRSIASTPMAHTSGTDEKTQHATAEPYTAEKKDISVKEDEKKEIGVKEDGSSSSDEGEESMLTSWQQELDERSTLGHLSDPITLADEIRDVLGFRDDMSSCERLKQISSHHISAPELVNVLPDNMDLATMNRDDLMNLVNWYPDLDEPLDENHPRLWFSESTQWILPLYLGGKVPAPPKCFDIIEEFHEHMDEEKRQADYLKRFETRKKGVLVEEDLDESTKEGDRLLEEDMESDNSLVWQLAHHWINAIIKPELEERKINLLNIAKKKKD